MKPGWTSSFAWCQSQDTYSFNFTCVGEGCDILDGFPGTTCTAKGDTLSCTNGVWCQEQPEYKTETKWTAEEDGASFTQENDLSICKFTVEGERKPGKGDPDVFVRDDTCVWPRGNNTSSVSVPHETTVSLVSSASSNGNTRLGFGLGGGYANHYSLLDSVSTSPYPVSTVSSSRGRVNSTKTSAVVETSVVEPTASVTPPAIVTAVAPRLHISVTGLVLSILLSFALLLPAVTASAIVAEDVNELDASKDNTGISQDVPVLANRAVPPAIDPTRKDINLIQLIELFQKYQLHKMLARKVTDGVATGTWWFERENWAEELKVNIVDDMLCKQLMAPIQDLFYKDFLFKTKKDALTKLLLKKFTGEEATQTGEKMSSLSVGFIVDVVFGWLHKSVPVLGKSTSLVCPTPCDDGADARLNDAKNCGTCGNVVSDGPDFPWITYMLTVQFQCSSGECINGACVVPTCKGTGESDNFLECGVGPNELTCTCASNFWGTGYCVQFTSDALGLTGDTPECEFNSDCAKGQACVTLPTGYRKACLDASSCLKNKRPSGPTETVPDFNPPQPEESLRPWVLHIREPADADYKLAYDENPVKLYALDPNLLEDNDKGDTTVNTKCINVVDTAKQQTNLPGFLGGVGSVIPSGFGIYWGYDVEEYLAGKEGDSCCLELYEEDDCLEGTSHGEACGVWIDDLKKSARSFRVKGCELLYQDI
ncbi:hypothetical protein B0T10DRAFT_502140 [Thelonectria olida]|uniref:Uncharacterized protein n=1 Tax=Thelonectria olida TaxID=1576542 RepID=A0A9P8VR51_9HYPO|nr:hypothetical protein B0T10DRAFT_502140 [Thelonectria olida]